VRLKARLARLELAFKTRNAEHFPEVCLCFPGDEQPWFRWRAEAQEAAKVLCLVHGQRFHSVQRYRLYQALHFYVTDFEHGWPHWSPQYQKAMKASLDPGRWPAEEVRVPWPQEIQELILRDGTRVKSGGPAVRGSRSKALQNENGDSST